MVIYNKITEWKGGDLVNIQLLKGARVSKGHTQESISKKIGMTSKTYNRKELGISDFSRQDILNISSILDLTIQQVNEIFFDNKLTERKEIA